MATSFGSAAGVCVVAGAAGACGVDEDVGDCDDVVGALGMWNGGAEAGGGAGGGAGDVCACAVINPMARTKTNPKKACDHT